MRGGATRPREHLQPNCPATHGSEDLCVRARDTRSTEAISTEGNFPEGSSHPAQPPKGPGGPQTGLITQRPAHRAHATLPLTTQTQTGWGQATAPGTSRARLKSPGRDPRVRPLADPPHGRGQGTTPGCAPRRAASPSPSPLPILGAPRGCPAAGVRSGPAAHRHCARRHLWPLHAPPRPSRSPARTPPRPASPAAMNM